MSGRFDVSAFACLFLHSTISTGSRVMRHLHFVILFGIGGVTAIEGRTVERVSVGEPPRRAAVASEQPSLSADGRYLAFSSAAGNLVTDDTNGVRDVFVHDRGTGDLTRVSVDSAGSQGNGGSGSPSISQSGRFVAFTSSADNLVAGDTNGAADIFVHDRQTATTTRVSLSSGGAQADQSSDSFVAISGNGRFVAFASEATNLVSGDTNGVADLFVHDRQTGATERISLDSNEAQANGGSANPSLSADGRFVAFTSSASSSDWIGRCLSGSMRGIANSLAATRSRAPR